MQDPDISWWVFMLVFLGVAGLLAWRAAGEMSGGVGRPNRYVVLAVSAASLTLGLVCLNTGSQQPGPLRISLEALQIERPTGDRMSVGGDLQSDELVVNGVPGGIVEALRTPNGWTLMSPSMTEGEGNAAVAQSGGRILGAQPLKDGDQFRLPSCTKGQEVVVTWRAGANRLELQRQDGTTNGPEMKASAVGLGNPLSARDLDIYPIRDYAPDAETSTCRQNVRSAFYRRGGEMEWLQLDAAVERRRDNKPVADEAFRLQLCLDKPECSTSTRLRILSVRPRDPVPQPRTASQQDLRSFGVAMREDGTLTLSLDTPKVLTLRRAELDNEATRLDRARPNLPHAVQLISAAAPIAGLDTSLSTVQLDTLGGAFADFSYAVQFDKPPFVLEQQGTSERVRNGDTIVLGGKQRAVVRLTSYDNAWPVFQRASVVLALGWLIAFLATFRARRESGAAFALFSGLELLLICRVLVAIEASVFDRSLDAQAAPAHALATFLLGPLLLSLASRTTYETPLRLLGHAVFVLAGLLWIDRSIGSIELGRFSPLGLMLSLSLLLAVVAGGYAMFERRMLRQNQPGLWKVWGIVDGVRAWRPGLPPDPDRKGFSLRRALRIDQPSAIRPSASLLMWIGTVILISIGRVALGIAGIQERQDSFALSIVYAPLVLVVFAWFFVGWRTWRKTQPIWAIVLFFVGLGLLYGLVVAMVSDTGAIIFSLPVVFGAWYLVLPRKDEELPQGPNAESRNRARWIFAAPAALVAIVLVVINGWSLLGGNLADRIDDLSPEEQIAELRTPSDWRPNSLRYVSLMQPKAVADAGIRTTEEITETNANIDLHTANLQGPGYLRSSPPVGLQRFHMNDNVSAVHLMGPFGRLGAVAYTLMLFAMLAVVLAGRAPPDDREAFGAYLGRLAIGTLVLVSVYMLMANSLTAPLTGRNVYLLSVASLGDFVEAMVLFGIGLLMLSRPSGEGAKHGRS